MESAKIHGAMALVALGEFRQKPTLVSFFFWGGVTT